MSKSLQEQLLSMGIADKKKAKKLKQEQHQQRKQRKARGKAPPPTDAVKAKIVQDAAAKARRDRELNRQRDAALQGKAQRNRVQQLIDAHRLDRNGADQPHRFVLGGKVKQLYVSGEQRDALQRGVVRIAVAGDRYELVPAAAAKKIAALDPDAVVELAPAQDTARAEGYEGFEVPDDLIW
jgi:uncharacterized protein YaiL (DUF2058 family)